MEPSTRYPAVFAVAALCSVCLLRPTSGCGADEVPHTPVDLLYNLQAMGNAQNVRRFDPRHTGRVTRTTYRQIYEDAWRNEIDAQGRGAVPERSLIEVWRRAAGHPLDPLYESDLRLRARARLIDRDRDGTVSHAEYMAYYDAKWDRIDRDRRGTLTLAQTLRVLNVENPWSPE